MLFCAEQKDQRLLFAEITYCVPWPSCALTVCILYIRKLRPREVQPLLRGPPELSLFPWGESWGCSPLLTWSDRPKCPVLSFLFFR